MLRYVPGLLLVQLATLALYLLNEGGDAREVALRAGLPALLVTLLTALWFASLARASAERDLARTRLEHERERERLQGEAAREREGLQREAAREREGVVREAERNLRREERRTSRRANLKVGLAFTATASMGVLFVLTELLTLGLLTMTGAGGALGGYLLRWRQTRGQARVQARERAPAQGAANPADGAQAGAALDALPAAPASAPVPTPGRKVLPRAGALVPRLLAPGGERPADDEGSAKRR